MTIMYTSCHTDVSTTYYYSLHTQWKLHHCVLDVRRQYPIAPLFQGDLAHAQTMCTRLSLCVPQNVAEVSLATRLGWIHAHITQQLPYASGAPPTMA